MEETKELSLADKLKMLDLDQQTIEKYKRANEILDRKEYKDAKKTQEELSKVIKEALTRVGLDKGDYMVHGVELKLSFQERSSINEDMLVQILEENNLNDAIIIKKIPDVAKVSEYIKSGQLSDEDFKKCVIINRIPTLKLGKPKKVSVPNPETANIPKPDEVSIKIEARTLRVNTDDIDKEAAKIANETRRRMF